MDTRPINLAYARVTERQICRHLIARRIQIIAALILADVLILSGGYVWVRSGRERCHDISRQVSEVRTNIEQINGDIGDVRRRQELSHWNRKLARQNMLWLDAISALTVALPGQTWLSRLETVPGSGAIKIDGATADMQSLSQIATRLASSGDFTELKLGSTESMVLDNRAAVRFSLSCRVPAVRATGESKEAGAGQSPQASATGGEKT